MYLLHRNQTCQDKLFQQSLEEGPMCPQKLDVYDVPRNIKTKKPVSQYNWVFSGENVYILNSNTNYKLEKKFVSRNHLKCISKQLDKRNISARPAYNIGRGTGNMF